MDIFSDIEKQENLNYLFKEKLTEDELSQLRSKSNTRVEIDEIFESIDNTIGDNLSDDNEIINEESNITIDDTITEIDEEAIVESENIFDEPVENNSYIDISNKYLEEETTPIGSYTKSKDQQTVEKQVESLVKKYNSRIPRVFGGGGVGSQTVREIITNYLDDGTLVSLYDVSATIDSYRDMCELASCATVSATTDTIINNYINDGSLASGKTVITVSGDYVASINEVILVNNTTNINIQIPSASASTNEALNIKKISNNGSSITLIAVDGNIDNDSTAIISSFPNAIELISDGTSWWII